MHQNVDPPMHEDSMKVDEDAHAFYRLLEDVEQVLYPKCINFTWFSFLVQLLHIKCLSAWSNKSCNVLLYLFCNAFLEGVQLLKNICETKKVITKIELSYAIIDACPNDCMLYWKDTSDRELCLKCGMLRWKTIEGNSNNKDTRSCNCKKFVAVVLHYFPLKQRMQMLFMFFKTAFLMRRHYNIDLMTIYYATQLIPQLDNILMNIIGLLVQNLEMFYLD